MAVNNTIGEPILGSGIHHSSQLVSKNAQTESSRVMGYNAENISQALSFRRTVLSRMVQCLAPNQVVKDRYLFIGALERQEMYYVGNTWLRKVVEPGKKDQTEPQALFRV
jgi:hypothetical protein